MEHDGSCLGKRPPLLELKFPWCLRFHNGLFGAATVWGSGGAAAKMLRRISLHIFPFHLISWQIATWGCSEVLGCFYRISGYSWYIAENCVAYVFQGYKLALGFEVSLHIPIPTSPEGERSFSVTAAASQNGAQVSWSMGSLPWEGEQWLLSPPGCQPLFLTLKPWPFTDHCGNGVTFDRPCSWLMYSERLVR